ncbi:Fucosyltransferase 1 [Hibiscus syriacus]|uniref:Fucosyltransferase 1 n=1 Tax=Hibiscus syriacus TaxID=106335 RepID=A0A6A2Y182_HIBSY|nr:Fucosyltransferase 1 [Hibiscus syriacus]
MVSRLATLKHSAAAEYGSVLGLRRWVHAPALPPPLDASISHPPPPHPLVLPESDQIPDSSRNNFGFGFPSFTFGGSMKLMAAPKRKK